MGNGCLTEEHIKELVRILDKILTEHFNRYAARQGQSECQRCFLLYCFGSFSISVRLMLLCFSFPALWHCSTSSMASCIVLKPFVATCNMLIDWPVLGCFSYPVSIAAHGSAALISIWWSWASHELMGLVLETVNQTIDMTQCYLSYRHF